MYSIEQDLLFSLEIYHFIVFYSDLMFFFQCDLVFIGSFDHLAWLLSLVFYWSNGRDHGCSEDHGVIGWCGCSDEKDLLGKQYNLVLEKCCSILIVSYNGSFNWLRDLLFNSISCRCFYFTSGNMICCYFLYWLVWCVSWAGAGLYLVFE